MKMNDYRHEYKYLIDSVQDRILAMKMAGVAARDGHVGKDGCYGIRSLYFDDYHNRCFYENENGTDQRAKYRIRYYDGNTDFLRLEKKIKISGMTCKESCMITKEQCRIFMEGKIPDIEEIMDVRVKRLFTEMRFGCLIPKVIVSYEREAFVYPVGNVRITFDRAISSSNQVDAFLSGLIISRPVLPQGMSVLEVKWDDKMPVFVKDALGMDGMQWTSFSKYYLCRKYGLSGGVNG